MFLEDLNGKLVWVPSRPSSFAARASGEVCVARSGLSRLGPVMAQVPWRRLLALSPLSNLQRKPARAFGIASRSDSRLPELYSFPHKAGLCMQAYSGTLSSQPTAQRLLCFCWGLWLQLGDMAEWVLCCPSRLQHLGSVAAPAFADEARDRSDRAVARFNSLLPTTMLHAQLAWAKTGRRASWWAWTPSSQLF